MDSHDLRTIEDRLDYINQNVLELRKAFHPLNTNEAPAILYGTLHTLKRIDRTLNGLLSSVGIIVLLLAYIAWKLH